MLTVVGPLLYYLGVDVGDVRLRAEDGYKMRTMRLAGLGLAAMVGAQCAWAAGTVCDARAYGAKGDGVAKDTAAIQKAIDACAAKGGGTIKLAGGTFLSGPILLKSNTTLDLAKDAILLGSPDRADYPMVKFARQTTVQPLVSAVNAEHVAISGSGTIDGNGKVWWDYVQGVKDAGVLGNDHPRPMGVVFDHSKHISMTGVTVQNAGFWQIVPYYSDDIVFRNLRILAPHSPNTDAIDPFSSSNIVIDHVFSSVGDDNIAIKSGAIDSPGPDDPSKNITITDCTFENGHGLSIGSEIAGGVQNVHAERIHFKGTDNGIRVKANRDRGNADIGNFSFKDITMEGVKVAILISEYYPKMLPPEGGAKPAPVQRLTPKFHDISIENVTATGSGTAGVIIGLPESPVLGVSLKNVHIEAKTGMIVGFAKVSAENFTVKAETGEGIKVDSTATLTKK
ncbi:Polygalacturonase [Granulicella rosea]|uniref:Polygalacturonase n=1 Tax=Granulicella rosea TaxID=474952 RepID=A0A239LAI9_9BACT|nr:glycoside hydrolase family 28 protein [Granulicella rosea]SNT27481.1 Polygalacturonase [Granulicella rosea]